MLFVFATSFLIRRILAARLDVARFMVVDNSKVGLSLRASVLRKGVCLFRDFGQVVHKTHFLGVLGGDNQEGEEFEES